MVSVHIVGAGIGGLSTALALAAKGSQVSIHERASKLTEVGAGIQLGPNAFRAFELLGIQQEMERIAFAPDALVLLDSPSGAEICRQELGEPFFQRFGYPYRVGYRADVHAVLLQALGRYRDQITLHLGSEIRGVHQDAQGVTLTDASGQSLHGEALIGADGLWSAVRTALWADGPPRVSGHIAFRAVLPVDAVPPALLTDQVQVWVGPDHHLVCYKLRAGALFNIVAIFHSSRSVQGWDHTGDPSELARAFESACPAVQQLLQQVDDWRMWVLCDRNPTPQWSVGRVTLLGDAAHPTLPYLAQGACMAIEDAITLAQCLDGRPDRVTAAFQEFERLRQPRTAHVQEASRQMGAINHATGAAREARNRSLAARDPRDYESTAWLFDWEPLAPVDPSPLRGFWEPAAPVR
jgi:salicylate hydroxylase